MRYLIALMLVSSSLFAQTYLFVIHAKEAVYHHSSSKLVLKDIDRSVTFFSNEQPTRAGKSDLGTFLHNLLNQKEPINSGFIFFAETKDKYSDIDLTLYKGHYDKEERTLSFQVKAEKELPQEMKEVNLFIDEVFQL